MAESTITRRGLVCAAAAGAVAAAAAPALAEEAAGAEAFAFPGEEPHIGEDQIAAEYDTEVLVVGAGNAGCTAALTAAQQGARTLLIEKGEGVGTARLYVGAVNSRTQLEAGVEIDPYEVMGQMAAYASWRCDLRLWKAWVEQGGPTVDWLADTLAPYGVVHVAEPDTGSGHMGWLKCFPTHTKFLYDDGSECYYLPLLVETAQSLGAEVLFQTSLLKLLTEGGRVVGAIATDAEGGYVRINASKGVILCTGGYSRNYELMNAWQPETVACTTLDCSPAGNNGDGLRAGLWAGGKKDTQATSMLFDRGICPPGSRGGEMAGRGYFRVGSQPFLKVNAHGERFTNESCPYDYILHAGVMFEGGVHGMIMDANYWQHIEAFHTIGCSRAVPSETVPATHEGYGRETLDGQLADFIEKGLVVQADTVEELAEKMMLPANALAATVGRYNEMCAQGFDEDFGKPAKDLLALDTPPFYGMFFGNAQLTTLDGLRINANAQVIDEHDQPIEGLYCAGDCAGGFYSDNYPELLVGNAVGKTHTFARIAALHATRA